MRGAMFMMYRSGIAALGLLILSLTLAAWFRYPPESVTAQDRNKKSPAPTKQLKKSSRIRGVIKGSEKPDQIPDMVAYELFLRTVGEGNARGLVKKIGLNEEQSEGVFQEARNLNNVLVFLDRQAFELKAVKKDFSALRPVQKRKDEMVERSVRQHLLSFLGAESLKKLKGFIDTRVKSNITKILLNDYGQGKLLPARKAVENSFAPAAQSGGELYLYGVGWQDESMNVFGSGSLSEQYTSNTSYHATVTVTSPSGRSNTTQGDWDFATIVHDTGLSIGVEDGTYSIEAEFEEQTGYYDEYGNFWGTGAYSVGTSSASVVVAPTVNIESVVPAALSFYSQQNGEFVANVSATNNVPVGTSVVIEMYETSVPAFTYTVAPTSRQKSFVIGTPGGAVGADFVVNITQTTSQGAGTNVKNKIKVQSVTPPIGAPAVTAGPNMPETILNYLGPAPTHSPTPPGGGGCRSGITETGEKYQKGSDQSLPANRCTPCHPDPMEYNACFESGGIYDWTWCYCGQSPIILDILGNGYELTDAVNGIFFDITATGVSRRIAWTTAETDDAWLVLDRNLNNRIDDGKEMFGNISEQPAGQNPKQGFASLGIFDMVERDGNGDGKITRRDAVFRKLRLWTDRNHNGVSEPEELSRLPAMDVVAIRLDYQESNRTDQHGNRFRYRARIRDRNNANVNRWAWDVFLRTQPRNFARIDYRSPKAFYFRAFFR